MTAAAPAESAVPAAPAEALAVAFGRLLRLAGLRVPVDTVLAFARALGELGVVDRDAVYWAGRATLVRRPEDHELYDRAFAVFWERRHAVVEPEGPQRTITITLAADDGDEAGDDGPDEADASDDEVLQLRFSASEVLRDKDFASCSDAELVEAQALMTQLRLLGARRRSRRLVPSRRPGAHPDLRRTVRAALRAGGEPIARRYLVPGERLRRLVLLLDVSGSMEPYARALVRFTHAAVVGRQRVEVFALGTRLTRITRELSSRDPDVALARAAQRVVDWSGGTRLGEGLRRFNDEWGVRGMARGSVVVILSDGWDRGSPELLAEQMERLHRVAFRVVWVNPLKVTPGYAPLARGMAAALPHVDEFVEGHSVAALEQLAAVIARP
jgi:uncharacterized protein with von Willebrand factor type A (vWA) domain